MGAPPSRPADKLWDVVSATRRSSSVAPRACVRVYARVLVPSNLYIHIYIRPPGPSAGARLEPRVNPIKVRMVWGRFLIAAAALKTPTRYGYNA